jgi:hypothetical protein
MAAPLGNSNAKKGKLVEDLLRKISVQEDHVRIRTGLNSLLDKAAEGDQKAMDFVRDTFDGKPSQSVQLSGDEESPLFTVIQRVIIDKNDSTPDSNS